MINKNILSAFLFSVLTIQSNFQVSAADIDANLFQQVFDEYAVGVVQTGASYSGVLMQLSYLWAEQFLEMPESENFNMSEIFSVSGFYTYNGDKHVATFFANNNIPLKVSENVTRTQNTQQETLILFSQDGSLRVGCTSNSANFYFGFDNIVYNDSLASTQWRTRGLSFSDRRNGYVTGTGVLSIMTKETSGLAGASYYGAGITFRQSGDLPSWNNTGSLTQAIIHSSVGFPESPARLPDGDISSPQDFYDYRDNILIPTIREQFPDEPILIDVPQFDGFELPPDLPMPIFPDVEIPTESFPEKAINGLSFWFTTFSNVIDKFNVQWIVVLFIVLALLFQMIFR